MLQQLLHILIISCICIAWGLPLYFLFLRKEHFFTGGFGKIIGLFFAGLLTLSLLSSWAILFFPLKFDYLLIATAVLIVGILLFLKKNKQRIQPGFKKPRTIPFFFSLACIFLFLLLGSLKPVNLDTHIYHLQIIRWANEYGTVPGIANLYPRFGLGSNWFNLISLFYIPTFSHQNFTFLNNTVSIWFLLWLLHKWQLHFSLSDSNKTHAGFTAFYFLVTGYCLFDWQLFRDASNSTSYDFIVTALTMMAICYLAENILLHKNKGFSFFFCLLSISVIPFKLSGIFILLLLFFYLLQFRNNRIWGSVIIAGILIITPLLIKNHISTGYPLFPATFSLNSPDWQLPVEMTKSLNDYIMNGNKFYNYPTSFMHQQEITTFNWIPFWIKNILIRHKVLFLLSFLSLFMIFRNPLKSERSKQLGLLIGVVWLMLAGWFFTAPDPRFAFGILLFLSFFPVSLLLGDLINKKIYQPVMLAAMIPVLGYAYIKTRGIDKPASLLVQPVTIEIPAYKIENRNGTELYNTRVNDDWMCPCAYTALPCLGENNPFVKPRSADLKDGFYMNPKPDSSFMLHYNY